MTRDVLKEVVEWVVQTNALIYPILLLPQIYRLIKFKEAKVLSLWTFMGFAVLQAALAAHGVVEKSPFLVLGSAASTALSVLVCVLIVYYRIRQRLQLRSGRLKSNSSAPTP